MTLAFWTIGHSTRRIETFVEALTLFQVDVLADIRRFPHSRRNPNYNVDTLRRALFGKKITYEFLGDELGGFRDPRPESPHTALADSTFQGYADHLASPTFAKGVDRLLDLAEGRRVACMCSERQPRDCHRKILSDFLVLAKDAQVFHILDPGAAFQHNLTPKARWSENRLIYAPIPLEEFGGAKERP